MNLKNFPKRLDSKTSCLRIRVPENLDLALEGLIRKVLREQPKTDDIYLFAANYFETLLKIREKAGSKFTAAQLCPFHNDEDAHEMIKLANTFPKPAKEKFKKRNEESLPSKIKIVGRRKKSDDKSQTKNDVGKPKVKETFSDKPIDYKKQTKYDLTGKIQTIKNPPQGKKEKQTKSTSRTPDELEEKEIDDGEFLTSDPIKELVEAELMMAATSTGKKRESLEKTDINVKSQEPFKTELSEQRAEEKSKPVDQINVQHETHDARKVEESLAEETKANKKKSAEEEKDEEVTKTQETKVKEETLANVERSEDTEEANEESTAVIKMNDMEKPESTEETNLGKPEKVETSLKEGVKALEKENKEKSNSMKEISLNGLMVSKDADKKKTDDAEITSYEGTRDIKKNLDTSLSKKQPLGREAQLVEEKNKKREEIYKHSENKEVLVKKETAPMTDTDDLTKIQDDIISKDKGELVSDETLRKDDSISIIKKEKEATRNVETESTVALDVVNCEDQVTIDSRQSEDKEDKNEIDQETDTKSLVGTETTEDKFQIKNENEAVETPSHKSITDGKDDISKVEVDNNQDQKEQEGKIMNDAAEKSERNELKTRKQILEEAQLKSNSESERQNAQQPEICVRTGPIIETNFSQKKEFSENGKSKASNHDALINNEKITACQTTKKQEIKINETKVTASEAIKMDENMPKTKRESENIALNVVSSKQLFKENVRELNSSKENHDEVEREDTTLTHEDVSISAKPAKIIKSDATVEFKGETKTLTNENQVKTIEETKTVEKVEGFVHSEYKQNSQIENTQKNEIPSFSQAQSKSTTGVQENGLIVDSNTTECQSTKKELSKTLKENMQQKESEDDLCTEADTHNQAEVIINKEKSSELLKFEANGTSNKENKTQLEELCSIKDIQHIPKQGESDVQKLEELNSDAKNPQNNEHKTEAEELCIAADILDISREDKTNKEEFTEVFQPEPETENNQVKEETQLEKLCLVSDGKNLTNENATDRNKPEEKLQSEEEVIKNIESEIEGFREVKKSPEIITVGDFEKAKNSETFKPSEEIQIKTIQTHYYDTLQVPDTVTKEYRVHSTIPSVGAIEENIDVNVPSSAENINQSSSPEATENINLEIGQTEDHFENIKSEMSPLLDLSDPQEIGTDTQKSNSDDLLNLMTPTSGYSLNLSELSLQTVSGTFLDNEKRYSSLEKEEIRYISLDTCETKYTTDYEKNKGNSKQEVEKIISKTTIPSSVGAVPMPPRDAEEVNENRDAQGSEHLTDKAEEKKLESDSSSPESSNGKSTGNETPFISVEVKTVIETQILDDDDDDNEDKGKHGEKILRPDVEVTVETTVGFQDEKEMAETASDSTDKKKGISEENTQEKSSLEEDQDKHLEGKQTESCSENKRAAQGREGASGESDSTTSSAATEIKRTDSAKRNFSPTRSLLSTQSLDLGKRNLLLKTRSLSTFRHGVTDFEVWNTIEKELEEAATKIQSKFRGYKTRKKLQRENAVQITTEESSVSTTPIEAETKDERQQSTGEFHDTIVLPEHPR